MPYRNYDGPRPVVVLPVQHPSQVLGSIHPLYTLSVIFSCKYEGRLRASARDHDVPPLTLYMRVLVVLLRPMVLEYLLHWHVHTTQVTAGQRLPPLFHHFYP